MKKDYDFVYRALTHKENTRLHYPALKNLLNLFLYKWDSEKSTKLYKVYTRSLRTALRIGK